MKPTSIMLLLWLLVPVLSSAEPADLPFLGSALPTGSKVIVSSTGKELIIDIKAPDSHSGFWQSQPTVRISYSTNLPIISLVANIGSSEETRLVLRPKNVGRHFDSPPEQLGLEADGIEIGRVDLFGKEGAIDTHRARYILKQDALKRLGPSFVLISGNPFAQTIETPAEQDGGGQPATRPESK